MKTIILILTIILAGAMISGHKKSAQNEKIEKIMADGKPKILFLLSIEKKGSGSHPSLWWANSGKPGC